MKRFLVLGILSGVLAAAPARAHGFFSLHVGVPGISVHLGAPLVCVRPAPVVRPLCVPRAVVLAPPVVVVRPAPVIVVPPRVVVARAPVVVVHPRPHRVVVAGPYRY